MKKYRLKQWYPSLLKDVRVGDIITENGQYYKGVTSKGISYRVEIWQLHPDFWELIEEEKPKPLFITEDGVEVFDQEDVYYVTDKLEKINSFINWFTIENMAKDIKIFKHESNADEYIWKNKPVFSYEDFRRWGNVPCERVIKELAMERSKK